jgi:hypothetical protein
MVKRESIEMAVSAQVNKTLLVLEAALQPKQFIAARKLVLLAFGSQGLGIELDRIFKGDQRK